MVAAVPTVEQVVDAIHTAMGAVGELSGHTIYKAEHHLEDDVELIKVNGLISGGNLNVWFIDLDGTSPFDGSGVGEGYDRYSIRIRYWSMRTNDAEWSKKARLNAQAVVNALADSAAIFAIGGQPQLFTPTTVAIVSHGPLQIRDVRRTAGQMIYETVLGLTVEARRYS